MKIATLTKNDRLKNRAYYDGDQFQFWIGPRIDPSLPDAAELNTAIERVFQCNNLIQQCVDRHVRALIGKPPNWYFKDRSGDRLEGDAHANTPAEIAEQLMQRWLNRVNSLAATQESEIKEPPFKAAVRSLCIEEVGYLRIWVPARFQLASDPIMRVAIHAPSPDAVQYHFDADKFLDRIDYHYQSDGRPLIESQFVDPETNETVFETLDESRRPIADPETGETQFRLNLGGLYTIQRMQAPSLINKSARDAQNGINYNLTMLLRNLEQAGFLERIIMGAQPPGTWEERNGRQVFVPDSNFQIGPGKTAFLQGMPLLDEDGALSGYTSPSMSYRDPVDVTTFDRTNLIFQSNLYHQMGQGHLLASDLSMSGIARVQARSDFDAILEEQRETIQAAIAGILSAALRLMLFPDQRSAFADLEAIAQLRYSTSRPLPEELDQNRQDYQAGLKSRTTAMAAIGIDDPDAEAQLIDEEKAAASIDAAATDNGAAT